MDMCHTIVETLPKDIPSYFEAYVYVLRFILVGVGIGGYIEFVHQDVIAVLPPFYESLIPGSLCLVVMRVRYTYVTGFLQPNGKIPRIKN